MFSYLVLGLGGLLFGAMVYRYDMHEREPWWMLVASALAGMATMAGAVELQDALLARVSPGESGAAAAIFAGVFETGAKLLVPTGVVLGLRRYFNDPMDGLIYGSLAGLGAAVCEGMYWHWLAPPAEGAGALAAHGPDAIRLVMHTLWGGIAGFALGLIVMKRAWRMPLLRMAGGVVAIHVAWDGFVGFAAKDSNWHRLVAALLVGVSVVWYGLLIVKANQWSRAMHAPTSKRRLAGRIVRALITRRLRP
ncbi:MAG: PrsW family glutamic-type intramembrane protease [Phycisphaeraceae bacterium]